MKSIRKTVTLDDDLNASIRAEMKRTGETLKTVLNRRIRIGAALAEAERRRATPKSK